MNRNSLRGKSFGWYLVRDFKDERGHSHFYYLGKDPNGCYLGFTPLANFCRQYLSQRAFLKLVNDEGMSAYEAKKAYWADARAQIYF